MKLVFVDTSGIVAAINARDEYHAQARKIFHDIARGELGSSSQTMSAPKLTPYYWESWKGYSSKVLGGHFLGRRASFAAGRGKSDGNSAHLPR